MASKKRKSGGRFGTLTSCISMTLVLLLLGSMVFFTTTTRNFSNQMRAEMPVAVLLKDSCSAEALSALQEQLRSKPYVRSVTYISKEQGAKETYESLQLEPGDFITDNPILAELELSLHGEYTNKASIQRIAPEIKKNPIVADVIYPIEEIDQLNHTISIVGTVLLVAVVLLTFVSFALISNTIRMNLYAHRHIIQTMKLVGARWGFIRRPFLWQAFRIGMCSALIAGGLIGAGIWQVVQQDFYISSLVTPDVLVLTLGSVLVCGLLLPWIFAFLSVTKYLRMRGGEANLA